MTERNEELEASVMRVLEQAPAVHVSEGFAAKVAAAAAAEGVPARPKARRVRLGRVMAIAAMMALAVALFVVAPMAGTRVQSWPFVVEMVLLAQLAAVGCGVWRLSRE